MESVFALQLGLVALFVVVGGVILWASYQAAKRRREELGALAAQRGWQYAERDDRWTTRFSGHPFGRGHDRRAENVVTGVHDGRRFAAFDYRFSTTEHSTDANGHRRSRTVVHRFSVVALELGVRFPELSVSPEGFFGRAIGRLTGRDIELESEEFNRAFTVTCPDRKFASDILHPQMMEFLLSMRDRAWRFGDGALLTIESGQHSLVDLDSALTSIDGIADRVPDFVWAAVDQPDPGRRDAGEIPPQAGV